MTKEQKFDNIIADFKTLLSQKFDGELVSKTSILKIIEELKSLKDYVYHNRIQELNEVIKDRDHLLRISTFELMEHNFRENSHSNVLEYLFNYNNLGASSIKILQSILQSTNTEISNYISSNLIKNKYKTFREFPTEKGRIDLLITDDVNKFNIVIENKLLADISIKEVNDKKEVTKTQLDDYFEFIDKNFIGYKNIFFFLSYFTYDDELNNYEKINYLTIFSALNKIQSNDIVFNEYKSLLTSIITGIDKREIAIILQKLNSNSNIYLNSIEKLNKLLNYEIQHDKF